MICPGSKDNVPGEACWRDGETLGAGPATHQQPVDPQTQQAASLRPELPGVSPCLTDSGTKEMFYCLRATDSRPNLSSRLVVSVNS